MLFPVLAGCNTVRDKEVAQIQHSEEKNATCPNAFESKRRHGGSSRNRGQPRTSPASRTYERWRAHVRKTGKNCIILFSNAQKLIATASEPHNGLILSTLARKFGAKVNNRIRRLGHPCVGCWYRIYNLVRFRAPYKAGSLVHARPALMICGFVLSVEQAYWTRKAR